MIERAWPFILSLTLFASLPAAAQVTAAEKASAEALFDRGLAALREGKLEEACARLEQSNAIERGIGTMLYLGECYEKSGRTASAWALFREAWSAAQAAGQMDRANQGRLRAERLEPVLSRLTIEVPESNRVPGLEITRNGIDVPKGLWGLSLPVDPGEQHIEARAPGFREHTLTLSIEKGPAAQRTTIPKLEAAPVAAIPSPEVDATLDMRPPSGGSLPPPPPAAPVRSGMSTPQIIGLATAGAGAVLLVVGTAYGARAIKKNNQAEDANCDNDNCLSQRGERLTDDAITASRVSNVGIFGGAALVAGGLLTYFLLPKRETKVALTVDKQSASLGVGGVF